MELRQIVNEVMVKIQSALRNELAAQGHVLTGNLSDSINFEITTNGRDAVGQMFFEDYGIYVNVGVSADRIPYGKGQGKKGGKSKYIQGLIEFWENRGLSGRDAVGAAFATAKVHAREGMPSRASYAQSQTGERTGFVQSAITNSLDELTQILKDKIGIAVTFDFEKSASESLSESLGKIRFVS